MELMPAAEFLAQQKIKLFEEKNDQEVKFPYLPFEERKHIKNIGKVVKDIRPNYPEYHNTKLYNDDHCKMWVHVCEATLETGITPVMYVPQSLPINDIKEKKELDLEFDFCESDSDEVSSLSGTVQ
jgi:hypothetical protein